MASLAQQLQARGFSDFGREIEPGTLGGVAAELVAAGLLAPKEGSAAGFRLTYEGYVWILAWLHLVAAFCPKCSTVVELPEGQPSAPARCPTCFVTWTEDTTAKPFVPKYG
jgi:hypothetical protein